jgi:hypothetical protein
MEGQLVFAPTKVVSDQSAKTGGFPAQHPACHYPGIRFIRGRSGA